MCNNKIACQARSKDIVISGYNVESLQIRLLIIRTPLFSSVLQLSLPAIGGLQPNSRDKDNNAAMYNCWWTNKRS